MTGQNTSHAVMSQRREAPDSADDFPTPPWGTRALIEHVLVPLMGLGTLNVLRGMTVMEPACNRGYMADPLGEYFGRVLASDVHDYGYLGMSAVRDFLFPGALPHAEFVITNPPFVLAEEFVLRALDLPDLIGTAMFVRTQFMEGTGRYERLFRRNPPTVIAPFTERVPLFKGVLRDPDKLYFDERSGKWKKPSTATSYSWFLWLKDRSPKPPIWIPPCRLSLTRAGDYPATQGEPHVE